MGDECWDQGAGEEEGAGSERGDGGGVRGGRGGGRWLLMKGQSWGAAGKKGIVQEDGEGGGKVND